MNDIAELKARPVLDLTDSDSDGVIDMLDQEVDTPSGAPVDTRGVALDSDGDGVADYKRQRTILTYRLRNRKRWCCQC